MRKRPPARGPLGAAPRRTDRPAMRSPDRAPARAPQRPERERPPEPSGPWLAPFSLDPALEARLSAFWLLPQALALALMLRLGHVIFLRRSPLFRQLVLDARAYEEWARRIVRGAWVGDAPFSVDPLYAYFLALQHRLFGSGLLAPRVTNALLGAATALLVAALAKRVWNSRGAGFVAALLVALYTPAIHYEGQLEKTALSLALFAGAALVWFRPTSTRTVLAAGALTGLATLARGNALVFLFAGALAYALGWWGEDEAPAPAPSPSPPPERAETEASPAPAPDGAPEEGAPAEPDAPPEETSPPASPPPPASPWRGRWRRAGLFLAGALPLVLLATAHNYRASRELVLTTTNLGMNLFLGNHAGNEHGYYTAPPFLRPDTRTELADFRAEAERRTGRTLRDGELSRYWTDRALAEVSAHPGATFARTVDKLWLTLSHYDVADSESLALVAGYSPILRWGVLGWGAVLSLAVLGAAVGWRRREVRALAALTVLYLATLLPFFMLGRLRIQALPMLAALASGGALWLAQAALAKDSRALRRGAMILGAVALVAFFEPGWMHRNRVSSLAISWYSLGVALRDAGKTPAAIRAFEQAIEVDDASVVAALRVLGELYQQRGELTLAEARMRRVLELRPDSRAGQQALLALYEVMLNDPRYSGDSERRARRDALSSALGGGTQPPSPSQPATLVARAREAKTAGRYTEAIRLLQESVRTEPYDEGTRYDLGDLMRQQATADEMVTFFSETLAQDRKPQTSQYFWAVGLFRRNDLDGALTHLRQALELDPAHEMSQHLWGEILERQHRDEEALTHYQEAIAIQPEFRGALEAAARLSERLGRRAEATSLRDRARTANPNSIRRFLYWARYLHGKGREPAAMAELRRLLVVRPDDAEALRLRDEIAARLGDAAVPEDPSLAAREPAPTGPGAERLTPEGRTSMLSRLQGFENPRVWIRYDARDAWATALVGELRAVFEEARWTVRASEPSDFALRPGMLVLAADDPASRRASAVASALRSAGFTPTFGSGYRAFSEERRRSTPTWRGFPLEPDQDFVLVVGRRQ